MRLGHESRQAVLLALQQVVVGSLFMSACFESCRAEAAADTAEIHEREEPGGVSPLATACDPGA